MVMVWLWSGSAWGQQQFRLEDGQWEPIAGHDPATPLGQLQAARSALAQDDPEAALAIVTQWLEAYPDHPQHAHARLLKGDALAAKGDYYQSLYDYEYVARHHPASPQFAQALQREYRIAKLFASGVKRKYMGLRLFSAWGEAEEIFIRIQERSPGSPIGEQASLALGDYYFDRAQMTSAAEAYDLFLANYPRSAYTQRAMLGLIRANLATFKGPRFDSTGLIEAAQWAKTLKRQFPAAAQRVGVEAMLVRIDESLALKLIETARWYQQQAQKISAIYIYQRVVRDYPQTAAAVIAIEQLTQLGAPVAPQGQAPPHHADAQQQTQPVHHHRDDP